MEVEPMKDEQAGPSKRDLHAAAKAARLRYEAEKWANDLERARGDATHRAALFFAPQNARQAPPRRDGKDDARIHLAAVKRAQKARRQACGMAHAAP